MYWITFWLISYIPVVLHKAAAEVSKIRNLHRRGELLRRMDGRANPLMDRKVVEAEALSLSLSLCLCLCSYLSTHLPKDLSVCLSFCLSVFPSICLSVYLFIYLSIYLYLYFSFFLKGSNYARRLSKVEVGKSKTKQACNSSSKQ